MCVTALKNTWRGVRASSPFQDKVTDLGFSSLPPCCWKPSQKLLLWDSTESWYVLLADNLLASSSWYSVIVQWLYLCFVPVCPFIGTHQPHNWEAATSNLARGWQRRWCRALPSQWLSQGKTALWDKSCSLGPWRQTPPWISHRHLRADPAPASCRGPGYFQASPAGPVQHGSSDTVGCCGDALAVPAGSRHHPTHPELVLTASQLQRTPKGLAWAAPAVFMDAPLPWSKPEAFPQPSSAAERLRLFFINTLKCRLQFPAHTVCYSVATPMSTVCLECGWSVLATMSRAGSWSSFSHVNV